MGSCQVIQGKNPTKSLTLSLFQENFVPTFFSWPQVAKLDEEEGKQVMKEAHAGVCGPH